jgi:hypothetical protein
MRQNRLLLLFVGAIGAGLSDWAQSPQPESFSILIAGECGGEIGSNPQNGRNGRDRILV